MLTPYHRWETWVYGVAFSLYQCTLYIYREERVMILKEMLVDGSGKLRI